MMVLNDLIKKLCPNGVEYMPLGKTAEIRSGWGFPNKEQGNIYGDIPFFKVSDMNNPGNELFMISANNYIDDSAVKRLKCKPAPKGTIIFPKIGAAIATNKKRILVCNSCYDNNIIGLIPFSNVENRYLYYLIDSVDLTGFADYSGAMPSIRKSTLEKYCIPVPPLEVQREIVRILDHFTELTAKLTAELTAELTARKMQYEYYRDSLLTQQKNAQWMTLGDIGSVCMCKRIMKAETSREGDVPFFKIGTFGKEPDAYITWEKFAEYSNKYSFPRKGDVLISAAGTIGRAVIYDGDPAYYQDSNIVWLDNDESKVLNKYLFYYYQLQPWAVSTGGTIARLYNDNISRAKISVPSLDEQTRIVSILDRFDALCNDLTSGLPAEIQARQKQYEYYRDKLLSFPALQG